MRKFIAWKIAHRKTIRTAFLSRRERRRTGRSDHRRSEARRSGLLSFSAPRKDALPPRRQDRSRESAARRLIHDTQHQERHRSGH